MGTGKPPAFQLFAGDFLSDTLTWTAQELGVHLRLLMWSWDNGPVPTDPKRMARIDPDASLVWETVSTKWVAGDGGLTNPRLEQTRADQKAYRERQAERGRRSAAARSAAATDEPDANHGSAVVRTSVEALVQPRLQREVNHARAQPQREDEVEDEVEERVEVENGEVGAHVPTVWPSFNDFYDLYDRKRGRTNAEHEWTELSQIDREAVMAATPAYVRENPKQFRKDPERYLKHRTWEDEIIVRNPEHHGASNNPSRQSETEKFTGAMRILEERRDGFAAGDDDTAGPADRRRE